MNGAKTISADGTEEATSGIKPIDDPSPSNVLSKQAIARGASSPTGSGTASNSGSNSRTGTVSSDQGDSSRRRPSSAGGGDGCHNLDELEGADLPTYVRENNATLTFPEKVRLIIRIQMSSDTSLSDSSPITPFLFL
jgi:hypothetical protein